LVLGVILVLWSCRDVGEAVLSLVVGAVGAVRVA
jgi:hypothetical protein